MTPVSTVRSAQHLIAREDVGAYLAGSVVTNAPVIHSTTPEAAASIARDGVQLRVGGPNSFGLGMYAATRRVRWYGPTAVELAIPNRRPLRMSWLDGIDTSLYLRRVARATGVDLSQLRAPDGRGAQLEAARQALLGAGFDSATVRTPYWPFRNTWLIGLDPARIRVIAPSP